MTPAGMVKIDPPPLLTPEQARELAAKLIADADAADAAKASEKP